jgi:hypothetical protein
MPSLATRLLALLRQMEQVITSSPEASVQPERPATTARVDYYAITPKGSRTRFQENIGLNQMPGNPQSETAVRSYLQRKRPGCDIQINTIDFD